MPVGVVRTQHDEELWERAKEIARERYPGAIGSHYYRIVMAIYKKMAHYEPHAEQHHTMRWPRFDD
ncbi:MAG TPA: hypothetical protein VMA09_01815 [Candidatus Binataceae bacterium]|nr:hypothetical protein [Candidatus Binataceae bacterium]